MQNLSKATSWVLYTFLAITVVFFAMFYIGGNVDDLAEYREPVYTDIILYYGFAILGIGIVCTVVSAIIQFVIKLKEQPKDGVRSLITLAGFAALLIITYSMGNGEPLNIVGYEGTQNTEGWLKLTDMWIYSATFLLAVALLSIIGFSAAKIFRK